MADDVARWLEAQGLAQYAPVFADNAIDRDVLPDLTDADLEKLGVLLGHRKKLLRAIEGLGAPEAPAAALPPSAAPAPQPAEAERRQLTVLFCDLAGSTALSARLDPEDMRDILRGYQDACTAVIARYDGYVAKYMGDGVVVYFGWPRAHEDDAERAIHAALELPGAVARIGKGLDVRIGIATGMVVVGDLIGEGAGQEAAVTGETPNLAARLQEIAGPGEVVIGETPHRLAGALFECSAFEPRPLKGFDAPVKAWRVLRPRRAETRFDAVRSQRLTELVGREEEVDILLRRWREVRAGDGQIVLVTGEPGIGKSRLAGSFEERIAGEAYRPVRLQCSPFHANSALQPMIEHLERTAGFEAQDDAETRLDKLEALLALSRIPGEASELSEAVLAALLSIPTDGRYPPLDLTPEQLKQRTLDTLCGRLVTLSRERPVLVVVEDAHWIDPTTLELVEHVVERAPDHAMMVVISYRREFEAPWVGRPRVTLVSLNRLDRRAAGLLVDKVADGAPLHGLREQIVERTDGVPLFVEELTRSILEAGGPESAGTGQMPVDIPATLKDLLAARLDRMGPAKEIAQIGAVAGRTFDYDLLSRTSTFDADRLGEALERLVESGQLMRRGDPPAATYRFKHALVQDAAYDSLLRADRERIHGRIAEILEARLSEGAAVPPETLAHHCTRAGFARKGAEYWLNAGRHSAGRGAMREAVSHLESGLRAVETLPGDRDRDELELDLLAALSMPLRMVVGSGHDRVEQIYERAYRLCRALGDTTHMFPVACDLTGFHTVRGQYARARREAEELLAIARADGDPAKLFLAHVSGAHPAFHMGDFLTARRHLEKAAEIREGLHQEGGSYVHFVDLGVMSRCYLGHTLFCLGYPDQGLAQVNRALALARELGQENSVCFALFHFGYFHLQQGEPAAALSAAESCIALGEKHGMKLFQGPPRTVRGWGRARGRGSGEDIAEIVRGIGEYRNFRMEVWRPVSQFALADAYVAAGQYDEALATVDDALAHMTETDEREYESALHTFRGDILLASAAPDAEAAEGCYRRALDVARAQSAKSWELRAATHLARLWQGQGKAAAARDLLAPIYGWFTEGFDSPDMRAGAALLAELG